ncbi:MAG: hypothetical protein GY816_07425 [Cytophagales bacterium]|nr:hypothetical protein [Cytophagales bacterium]
MSKKQHFEFINRTVILVVFLSFLPFLGFSQTPTIEVIPPSPDAASLGKYGDTPVGMYTGIPNITVPLHQISEKDVNIPISISYHAGGIKVEEEASWVGLGWSLNAGGVITRSVRGLDDTRGGVNGTISESEMDEIRSPGSVYDGSDGALITNLAGGIKDGEPDIFFYNFLGYSGKFIYRHTNASVQLITQDDISISIHGSIGAQDYYWIVKTPDGFTFEFEESEATITTNSAETSQFLSSWYLSKIISPIGRIVDFTYKDNTQGSFAGISAVKYTVIGNSSSPSCPDNLGVQESLSYSTIATKTLERITFENGRVEFYSSLKRADLLQDLALNPRGYKLDKIEVFEDGVSTPLKRIDFIQSFFSRTGTASQINSNYELITNSTADTFEAANHRLKLSSVIMDDQWYEFFYYDQQVLPRKDSKIQDHWGYINSTVHSSNASSLIASPTATETSCSGSSVVTATSRDANPNTYYIGMLEKITYPTGGYSEFVYEPNQRVKTRTSFVPVGIGSLNTNSTNAPYERWMGLQVPTGLNCTELYVKLTIGDPIDNNGKNLGVRLYEVHEWESQAIYDLEFGIRTMEDFTLADAVSYTLVHSYGSVQNQVHSVGLIPNGYYLLNVESNAYNSTAWGVLYGKTTTSLTYDEIIGGARIQKMALLIMYSFLVFTEKRHELS